MKPAANSFLELVPLAQSAGSGQLHAVAALQQVMAARYPDQALPDILVLRPAAAAPATDDDMGTFHQHINDYAAPIFMNDRVMHDSKAPDGFIDRHPDGIIVIPHEMLALFTPLELHAVVAHEYGHAVLGHLNNRPAATPILSLTQRAMTSRVQECEADHFTMQFHPDTPRHLVSAIVKIREHARQTYGEAAVISGEEEETFGIPNTHPRDSSRLRLAARKELSGLDTSAIRFSGQCEILEPIAPAAKEQGAKTTWRLP